MSNTNEVVANILESFSTLKLLFKEIDKLETRLTKCKSKKRQNEDLVIEDIVNVIDKIHEHSIIIKEELDTHPAIKNKKKKKTDNAIEKESINEESEDDDTVGKSKKDELNETEGKEINKNDHTTEKSSTCKVTEKGKKINTNDKPNKSDDEGSENSEHSDAKENVKRQNKSKKDVHNDEDVKNSDIEITKSTEQKEDMEIDDKVDCCDPLRNSNSPVIGNNDLNEDHNAEESSDLQKIATEQMKPQIRLVDLNKLIEPKPKKSVKFDSSLIIISSDEEHTPRRHSKDKNGKLKSALKKSPLKSECNISEKIKDEFKNTKRSHKEDSDIVISSSDSDNNAVCDDDNDDVKRRSSRRIQKSRSKVLKRQEDLKKIFKRKGNKNGNSSFEIVNDRSKENKKSKHLLLKFSSESSNTDSDADVDIEEKTSRKNRRKGKQHSAPDPDDKCCGKLYVPLPLIACDKLKDVYLRNKEILEIKRLTSLNTLKKKRRPSLNESHDTDSNEESGKPSTKKSKIASNVGKKKNESLYEKDSSDDEPLADLAIQKSLDKEIEPYKDVEKVGEEVLAEIAMETLNQTEETEQDQASSKDSSDSDVPLIKKRKKVKEKVDKIKKGNADEEKDENVRNDKEDGGEKKSDKKKKGKKKADASNSNVEIGSKEETVVEDKDTEVDEIAQIKDGVADAEIENADQSDVPITSDDKNEKKQESSDGQDGSEDEIVEDSMIEDKEKSNLSDRNESLEGTGNNNADNSGKDAKLSQNKKESEENDNDTNTEKIVKNDKNRKEVAESSDENDTNEEKKGKINKKSEKIEDSAIEGGSDTKKKSRTGKKDNMGDGRDEESNSDSKKHEAKKDEEDESDDEKENDNNQKKKGGKKRDDSDSDEEDNVGKNAKQKIKNTKEENDSDEDDSDEAKKNRKKKWRKDKLLTEKIDTMDSEEESEKKCTKNKKKNSNSDDDDDEPIVKKPTRRKLTRKVKKAAVLSDSDESSGENKKDKGSSDEESEHESNSSNNDDKETEESKKKQTKKKRIKRVKDSSSDEDDDKSTRKNIRRLLDRSSLSESTIKAEEEEKKRKARIAEKQKKYNAILEDVQNTKVQDLILEYDEENKKDLLPVHKHFISKLKPHQANGVRFMWDACFESLDRCSKEGSGCILAHCMGLGKTLQVITLAHTLLTHSEKTCVNRVMVVCPINTVLNWKAEFKMWMPRNSPVEVYELVNCKLNSERQYYIKEWFQEGGVLIIGYTLFRMLSNPDNKKISKKIRAVFLEGLVDPGPDLVICDEGHLLKNEKTNLSIAMNRIKTKRRIVLTGTPLQNNLKEYWCMVQFIKPNLLGTYKEYLNRFVNPITNGQYTDSTQHDIIIMRKRSHVLHKLLDGVVQRRDYSVLEPYLPPKHEYVLFVKLTDVQIKLYKHYMARYARKGDGFSNRTSFLFTDFQMLQRICTHPRALGDRNCDKKDKDTDEESIGSLKDFIDDAGETPSSSSGSSSDSESGSEKEGKSKRKFQQRSRVTRALAAQRRENNEESDPELEEIKKEWWQEFCDGEELDNLNNSGKMFLLFQILKECEEIGDKILVFSQSLYTLNCIEYFLEKVDEATQSGNTDKVGGLGGSWALGLDYFRLDGSSSCDNRAAWCNEFNDPDNTRARLFLISTKAGGLGINLVAANRVIIFDVSWNPSHDIQSIYRVYRFGQTKPCYIYRFVTYGAMEMKIYERQVTKQAISKRVIDEQQIDRHYNQNDLQELYKCEVEPEDERPIPLVPKDVLLGELLQKLDKTIYKYHLHQSLLENKTDEGLNEEERKAAWEEFENEKVLRKTTSTWNAMGVSMGLTQINMNAQNIAAALTNIVRKDNPTWSEIQIKGIIPALVRQLQVQMSENDMSMYSRVLQEMNVMQAALRNQMSEAMYQQQVMRAMQEQQRRNLMMGNPQQFAFPGNIINTSHLQNFLQRPAAPPSTSNVVIDLND